MTSQIAYLLGSVVASYEFTFVFRVLIALVSHVSLQATLALINLVALLAEK